MTYREELNRFKKAVSERKISDFFLMSTENSREMKAVYTRLDNITQFIEWLEMKADEEESEEGVGGLFISVGGGV